MPSQVAQIPQSVMISQATGVMTYTSLSGKEIRKMRRNPTIFFARLMVRAAILGAEWTVESAPGYENTAIVCAEHFLHYRDDFLESAVSGCLDWGWQPFELVWAIEEGELRLKKIKPLIQDITDIVADSKTGEWDGYKQGDVEISRFSSMLININVEGDMHKGESYLGNVQEAYTRMQRVNGNSDTYDTKIAGAHWIIRFPEGSSLYQGVETENEVICSKLIQSLQNSGSFGIPKRIKQALVGLNDQSNGTWEIELVEASGSGANFEERLNRCDKEIVRGYGLPERSILEGQYGTKAEAGEHGDFAITGIELLHRRIVSLFNKQAVNTWLKENFGDDVVDKVYIKAQPLTDSAIATMRSLYDKILTSPEGSLTEIAVLDVDAIRDRLGIPYTKRDAQSDSDA